MADRTCIWRARERLWFWDRRELRREGGGGMLRGLLNSAETELAPSGLEIPRRTGATAASADSAMVCTASQEKDVSMPLDQGE